jgi:hypothetical protein
VSGLDGVPDRRGVHVQVLFASRRASEVALDLLAMVPVQVGERHFPSGTPFTMTLQMTDGLASFITAVTDQWASRGEIVGLDIEVDGPQITVRLDGPDEQLVLAVVDAPSNGSHWR